MPWLAPIGTPEASGPVESQVPIWQSIRASRSLGVGFHPRQRLRQHRQALQRLGVAVRVRLARADALDAMIDGADSGRKPQPFRRVHAEPGIEDHRARHQQRMAQRFLDLGLLVGDASRGGELAAGNRRRHADLAHRRRGELRRSAATGPDPVDVVRIADIVGEAELHRLGAVGDRTAADGNDEIGIAARAWSPAAMTAARGVCGGIASKVPAQRAPSARRMFSITSVSRLSVPLTIRKARVRAQPVQLLDERLGCRPPEHDLIHRAEYDTTFMHGCPPGHFGCLSALAPRLAEEIRDVMSEGDAVVPVGWVEPTGRANARPMTGSDTHRHAHWC